MRTNEKIRQAWQILTIGALTIAAASAVTWTVMSGVAHAQGKSVELLNVSYDPTRELWRDLNAAFIPKYSSLEVRDQLRVCFLLS